MKVRSALLFPLIILIAAACTDDTASDPSTSSVGGPAQVATAQVGRATQAVDFQNAVELVVERVRPAVVQITNEQGQGGLLRRSETVPAGVGSGVIYDDQGRILTNDHVIEGAERLLVTLPDGRSFPGKLIGRDPQTDLAVLQISADNLPRAELGDSSTLRVGQWVVAIGNALGLPGGPTVTSGVVSALGRAVQEPGDFPGSSGPLLLNLIQTDASINPGNSGGPLVNLAGQVIGINTLVAGQAESGLPAQGIGFAISTGTVKRIAEQLVRNGRAIHPYIGIRYVPLTPAIATELGTNTREGVAIAVALPGSPADRAGLRPRDIVTSIEGQALRGETAFAEALEAKRPGDTVTLTVERGGRTQEIKVTLGEAPSP